MLHTLGLEKEIDQLALPHSFYFTHSLLPFIRVSPPSLF